MADIEEMKGKALAAIDARRRWLIDAAERVGGTPETGFRELATSRSVSEMLGELGVPHETGLALTGIKGYLEGGTPGPTVAVIGELDAVRVPDHPRADPETGAAHACGHHCQIATMLGAAVGLAESGVLVGLSGRVALMAVPAEEFIDVQYRWDLHMAGKIGLMAGKQELVRLGAFDDVDMAMMVHTSASPDDSRFSVGGTSSGHLVKMVRFIGRASHAGGAPHRGVNALQAAMVALNAVNAQRETLKNEDAIRLHGILTEGGASANSTPSDVRYEGRVRARTLEALADANMKMDRALRAGALAVGANVSIVTVPGYLPMVNDEVLTGVFRGNAARLVGDASVVVHPPDRTRGGSTDMGDLSQILPAIHPYSGGASGLGHGADYAVSDYGQAVIDPARAVAMSVIDLLACGASKAREVIAASRPRMSRAGYLRLQGDRLAEELYVGE